MTGLFLLFERPDGVTGCFLKGWMVPSERTWMGVVLGLAGLACVGVGMRVRDEERMMKEKWGARWEVWHSRTKRFIPGLF